jgi:hypothetical protein
MAAMMLCKAPKNREVDNTYVYINESQKTGSVPKAKEVVMKHEKLMIDSHTPEGKDALRNVAGATGVPYQMVIWRDFLENGAVISPHQVIDGDSYGHRVYRIFGVNYPDTNENSVAEASTAAKRPEI